MVGGEMVSVASWLVAKLPGGEMTGNPCMCNIVLSLIEVIIQDQATVLQVNLRLNTLTQTCLIFREHYEFMIDLHSYTHNLSSLGLNGIRTHDFYHTSAVPLPLPTELSSHLGAGHFVSL